MLLNINSSSASSFLEEGERTVQKDSTIENNPCRENTSNFGLLNEGKRSNVFGLNFNQ